MGREDAARSRRPRSEWAVSPSSSVEPCSCAGCARCGVAHSAGPFSQEWAVTPRTHGPPEGPPGRPGAAASSCRLFRQNATAECVPAMSRRATSRSSRTRERRASDRRRRRGRGPQGSVRDPTPTYTALEVRIEDVQAASRPVVGASREATARTGVAVILMEPAASCSASSWKLLQRSP
jgi:hypothetical protein